jgi:arsenate reductase
VKATIYGIKNCDTMKKAFAWLDAHGIKYAFHDYKRAGVPADRFAVWAKSVGWERLVNTRGPTWRKIPEESRSGLDEARALKLLQQHPSAIKRPVLEHGKTVLVGFDAAEYARVFDQ